MPGDSKYEDAVSRVSEIVHGLDKNMGLVPIFINANSGKFRDFAVHLKVQLVPYHVLN